MPVLKCFSLIAMSLLYAVSYSQIGAKIQMEGIVGNWENNEFGRVISLTMDADGRGVFDGESFTYSIQGNTVTFFITGTTTTYTYQVQGNQLSLSGGDLDGPIEFIRSGSKPAVASGNNSITSKMTETKHPGQTTPPSGELTGIWSGNGETIEFKSNGQCSYLGQSFPYFLNQDHITFSTSEGDITFTYSVQGDQLSLSANGQTVSYTRNSAMTPSNQQSINTRNVPLELTGQWCWIDVNSYSQGASSSSRCITLNADGTYAYFSEASRSVNTPDYYGGTNAQESDRGTWYVQGDRIYYNSQTTGQGSYRLEKRNHPQNVNDPMIILDGEAYVTATQRPPWR